MQKIQRIADAYLEPIRLVVLRKVEMATRDWHNILVQFDRNNFRLKIRKNKTIYPKNLPSGICRAQIWPKFHLKNWGKDKFIFKTIFQKIHILDSNNKSKNAKKLQNFHFLSTLDFFEKSIFFYQFLQFFKRISKLKKIRKWTKNWNIFWFSLKILPTSKSEQGKSDFRIHGRLQSDGFCFAILLLSF